MRVWWLVLVFVMAMAPRRAAADGEVIALLPLDTEPRFEIYGQPVAAELARALGADKLDVVVVSAKMAMPEKARLVVDGTIKSGGGEKVALTARIRDRATGTVVAKAATEAQTLTDIDSAASQLGKQVLAAVKEQLAKRQAPIEVGTKPPVKPPGAVVVPPAPRTISVDVKAGGPLPELAAAATDWAAQHHRTIGTSGEDAAVALDVLAYTTTAGEVPTARARVHVQIKDHAKKLVFDRVVVTDTIVGDRKLPLPQLAARAAREVLAIVEPNMRRAIEGWR